MRRTSQTSLIALATVSALALTTPAFAQDTPQPAANAPAAQPAATSGQGVGEIVVTATRRSENLQDIPLSDRKSTRLNSSHIQKSRMPSSA